MYDDGAHVINPINPEVTTVDVLPGFGLALEGSWLLAVLPGVLLVLGLGFYGAPLWMWAAGILIAAWLLGLPPVLFGILMAGLGLFLIVPLRRSLITRPLMSLIRTMGIVPTMSETEQIAIEAGDVGVEAELFSSRPDFSGLMEAPYPELTDEERAFLEGPVEELCGMVDDWTVWNERRLPEEAWDHMKQHGYLGLIIPEEYGGKGFSPAANSAIVQKLATKSYVLAISVMVPNSLGPAELLLEYGTQEQKERYLPDLASGEEIPCFGLTEPRAGSDAGSIRSSGEVFRDDDGELKMRLNWEKRWITLAPVATLIGLAFRLSDPENHLGKGEEPGITCALIPADTDGVSTDRFHDPLGVPFHNGPTTGEDVVVSVDRIIGGRDGAGEGWKMLMECLNVGRGISLPATAAGSAKYTERVLSAHGVVRRQFGLPIGKFEGVEEPLARVGGYNYLMEATRRYVTGQLLGGTKPAVVSAMAKYYLTELGREVINDGMDVRAGSAITRGPKNMLAHTYIGTPISITVEGANILSRTMIIFGQGSIRCHPHLQDEMFALMNDDLKDFDRALWGHVSRLVQNTVRAGLHTVTRGWISLLDPVTPGTGYGRKLSWATASFAFLGDLALTTLGGRMRRKEKLTGRFADVFSWLFIATAVLRRSRDEGRPEADEPFRRWALDHCFHRIQEAFEGLYRNLQIPGLTWLLRLMGVWARWNRIGSPPSDALGQRVAKAMQRPGEARRRRTRGIHEGQEGDPLHELEEAFRTSVEADDVLDRVKDAIRDGTLPEGRPQQRVEEALEEGIISESERDLIHRAEQLRHRAIQVDDFPVAEFERAGL